jgi:hypothetical protein
MSPTARSQLGEYQRDAEYDFESRGDNEDLILNPGEGFTPKVRCRR